MYNRPGVQRRKIKSYSPGVTTLSGEIVMGTTELVVELQTLLEKTGSRGYSICLRQKLARHSICPLILLSFLDRHVAKTPDSKKRRNQTINEVLKSKARLSASSKQTNPDAFPLVLTNNCTTSYFGTIFLFIFLSCHRQSQATSCAFLDSCAPC